MTEDDKWQWKTYEQQHPLDFNYKKPKSPPAQSSKATTKPGSNKPTRKETTVQPPHPDDIPVEPDISFGPEPYTEDDIYGSPETSTCQHEGSHSPQTPEPDPSEAARSPPIQISESVSDMPKEEQGPCRVCQTMTAMKCMGCRKIYYCSREHQKTDWKARHKNECKGKAIAE